MTIQRYLVAPGSLQPHPDGGFVAYDDAKRDIQRLGDELFAARAELRALYAQRESDLKIKDAEIAALTEKMRQAVIALGYGDPEEV